MKAFAALLDRLYFTSSSLAKARILREYLVTTPDPDRGWAIAAIGGTLNFDLFKRKLIRDLLLERVDPVLFDLSYDYVGELSETVAHMWPAPALAPRDAALPGLAEVVDSFSSADKPAIRARLIELLDAMNASERWALVKLGTRGLRIGVSARFLKKILADYGGVATEEVERLWHAIDPPYTPLLQWLEGKAPKPDISERVTFHPVMLAHPLEKEDYQRIDRDDWQAEWKYDGIRVQLNSTAHGAALYSRTGDDISHSFPDVMARTNFAAILDGELLVKRDGEIAPFNHLQQRLNKKKPGKKLLAENPAWLTIYDALSLDGVEMTHLPLATRRRHLECWYRKHQPQGVDISEILAFESFEDLQKLRAGAERGGGNHIEGLMLKHRHSIYLPGRPKGQWFKWKRDPMLVDAVMMYAQRGHGKRSSFYSDYTFGLWRDEQLLPIGKAYSGFTDEELRQLDRWVRNHTTGRFGPVREVEKSLVLEVAFDSVQASKRHKSGVALRFPRIHRIRWDKPAREADVLRHLLAKVE